MSWSAEQQRLLGEMGYQLMVRVIPGDRAGAATDEAYPHLRMALRRAAGDQEIAGLIADFERLRREPALKRALWPTLRALRRSQ